MKKSLRKKKWDSVHTYLLLICLFLVYVFGGYALENILLIHYGICKKAVITDNTSTWSSRFTQQCLMYEFEYEGKTYWGNSLIDASDASKVGDSICIVYLKSYPRFNRSVSFFDKGEIKCDCK